MAWDFCEVNGEYQIGVVVRNGECGIDWELVRDDFTGDGSEYILASGQDCETGADVVEDVRSVLNEWVRELEKALDTKK